MRRRIAIAVSAAAAIAGGLLLVGPSLADGPAAVPAPTAWMTPAEADAVRELDQGKPLAARRKAEALIEADPDSIVGHYVLGRVLHEAESSLGRAIYHLGHARELYERRYPVHERTDETPWKFHRELLYSIQALAAELEDFDYQLQILDFHDALYRPELVAEHAWPLFKLGRLDEARKVAEQAVAKTSASQRSLGLNVLCAIENARGDRESASKACTRAFENARDSEKNLPAIDPELRSTLAVHAFNAARTARQAFQPERAEALAIEGTKRLSLAPVNPWRLLVDLYLDEGRGEQAVRALREMNGWRKRQPPQVRDQDRADTDVSFATMLLLAGRAEPALRLVGRAIEQPDRRGLTSVKRWQSLGAHALLRRALRREAAELDAEAASIRGRSGGWRRPLWFTEREFDDWADEERIVAAVADDERLVDTFRIFGERGLTPVPVWLMGDLVDVVGPGAIASVLRRVRREDAAPELVPYLRAIEVDVLHSRGDHAAAMRQAREVLSELPEIEVLLRARIAAVGAMAASEADNRQAELEFLEQAFVLDPSVIRRLGLSLPAQIRTSGGGDVQKLSRLLEQSPRLRAEESGFHIDIAAEGTDVRFCISSPAGAQLSCATTADEAAAIPRRRSDGAAGEPAEPPADEPMTPQRAAELFHRKMFSYPLGLTGLDVGSLDGSTTVSEQASRDHLEGVLDDMTRGVP